MGRPIRQLANEPLFFLGMAVRVILVIFLAPAIHGDWFVPFIDNFIDNPGIDPWRIHMDTGGNVLAFPYGPVMWLLLLPATAPASSAEKSVAIVYAGGCGIIQSPVVPFLVLL